MSQCRIGAEQAGRGHDPVEHAACHLGPGNGDQVHVDIGEVVLCLFEPDYPPHTRGLRNTSGFGDGKGCSVCSDLTQAVIASCEMNTPLSASFSAALISRDFHAFHLTYSVRAFSATYQRERFIDFASALISTWSVSGKRTENVVRAIIRGIRM